MRGSRGFTVIELIIVLVVIGILSSVLIPTIQGSLRSSRTDQVESKLRSTKSGFSDYFNNYGKIKVPLTTNQGVYKTAVDSIIADLNADFLPDTYELGSDLNVSLFKDGAGLTANPNNYIGFNITSKYAKDPWGSPYSIFINTNTGIIIISSFGADKTSARATYKTMNYGDDIIAIVQSKSD